MTTFSDKEKPWFDSVDDAPSLVRLSDLQPDTPEKRTRSKRAAGGDQRIAAVVNHLETHGTLHGLERNDVEHALRWVANPEPTTGLRATLRWVTGLPFRVGAGELARRGQLEKLYRTSYFNDKESHA